MKEAEVKKRVKALCAEHGAYFFMVVPTGYGRKGIPDFLICHKGRFIAVETKRGAVVAPSPHQAKELKAVTDAGGVSLVINATNLDVLEEELKR